METVQFTVIQLINKLSSVLELRCSLELRSLATVLNKPGLHTQFLWFISILSYCLCIESFTLEHILYKKTDILSLLTKKLRAFSLS